MFKVVMPSERGFTLIEMSIVLIIIGLIIGGILKGQELIESARQKNFVSQTDAIKAAVNTFVDRFRSFPGDSGRGTAICGAPCVAGDDNGIVNAAVTGAANIAGYTTRHTGENYQFFNHLVGGGFLGGGGAALVATGSQNFAGGTQISPLPQSAFPQSGITVVYGTHEGAATNAGSLLTHWLQAHRYVAGAVTTAQAIVAPARMSQLDLKFDDGAPDTGRIRGSDLDTDCGNAGTGGTYSNATDVQCDILMALE